MAKILIVEDDNHLREIYELRMQAAGHEVVSAADGEEALKVAIKEKPDLVISDVMMPKISGFDMLDILRTTEETKNAKIIMMTALSQAEDKQRAENLGADRYLVKSQVTLDDVAQVTEEVLSGKPAPEETSASANNAAESSQENTQPNTVQTTQTSSTDSPAAAPTASQAPPSDDTQQQNNVSSTDDASTATQPPKPASDSPTAQPPQTQAPHLAAVQPSSDPDQSTASPQQPTQQDTESPANPQDIENEESAIAKQIEDFMHTNEDNNEAGQPQPSETQAQPAATSDVNATQQQDQQTVESPAETNNQSPEQQPSTENQPPSAVSVEAPSKKKKVIQPINDLTASKADELNNLLQKEEVKEEMSKVVSDIQTKDIADLSNNDSAEKALKDAQNNFNQNEAANPDAATQPQPSNQDIKISAEGTIEDQNTDEAEAAEILKQAQANKEQPEQIENTAEAPQQTQTPVIPHTNGVAMDGVVPQPKPQTTPQTTQTQAQQTTPQQPSTNSTTTDNDNTAPNPNDIAL